MAHDGLARAVRPVHTLFDGDTVFAIATGARDLSPPAAAAVSRIGMWAADCMARAVGRGVHAAETLGAFRGYREVHGAALGKPRDAPA